MNQPRGVGITQVIKDSPAEKAGLKKDDVILRLDGEALRPARGPVLRPPTKALAAALAAGETPEAPEDVATIVRRAGLTVELDGRNLDVIS